MPPKTGLEDMLGDGSLIKGRIRDGKGILTWQRPCFRSMHSKHFGWILQSGEMDHSNKMKLIEKESFRILSYQTRKKNLVKKVTELSILCDVEALLITYGPKFINQPIMLDSVWPENSNHVRFRINKYKMSRSVKLRPRYTVGDYFSEKNRALGKEISNLRKKICEVKYPSWDGCLNNFSVDQLKLVAARLDYKIEDADKKMKILKQDQIMNNLMQNMSRNSLSYCLDSIATNWDNFVVPNHVTSNFVFPNQMVHSTKLKLIEKRKKNLVKKVNELSILCDVEALLIMYGPKFTDQPIMVDSVWPENPNHVRFLINKYKMSKSVKLRPPYTVCDYFWEKNKKVGKEILNLRKKICEVKYPSWDVCLNNFSVDQLKLVAARLDYKIGNADKKMKILKQDQIMNNLMLNMSENSLSYCLDSIATNWDNFVVPDQMTSNFVFPNQVEKEDSEEELKKWYGEDADTHEEDASKEES
ncbi:uncharacterized protein [Euphorbia lathyris]|uniref:uncharacterized protein n=1 Tax=Euphorbia lathyris TaxID=212925 RepID=UPI003313898F